MVKVVVVAGLVGVVRSISRVGLGRRVSDWHSRYRAARAAKNVQQHKLSPRSTFCCSAKMYLSQITKCICPKKDVQKHKLSPRSTFCGCTSVCSFFASSAVAAFGGNLKRRLHHCTYFRIQAIVDSHTDEKGYISWNLQVLHISVWKGKLKGHQGSDIEKRVLSEPNIARNSIFRIYWINSQSSGPGRCGTGGSFAEM